MDDHASIICRSVIDVATPAGADPRRIYMDYCVAYLVSASVTALTLGQLGSSDSGGKPNFLQQLPQRNAAAAGWAIGSGVCVGLGDAAMQYSIALLGLSVGPAVINSLIVIVGVYTHFRFLWPMWLNTLVKCMIIASAYYVDLAVS